MSTKPFTAPGDEALALIDAYLAGELDAAGRASVDARVAADGAFRAEFEAQQALDHRLKSALAPPALAPPVGAPGVAGRVGGGGGGVKWWLGLAAVLALMAVAGYVYWPSGAADGLRTPEQVYATIVKGGFKPAIVCPNDPAEFARLVKGRLGVSLTPSLPADSGIALTGWGYGTNWGTPLGEGTMILLATRGESKVVVFIDRKRNDRTLREPGGGKRLFRKETGDLVLYEISPLAEPIVLPALEAR